jgi:predicted dehydrogenase
MTVAFGIVGCGGAAVEVTAAIGRSRGATVVATHDLDVALAEELAAPSGARVLASLDEVLEDPDVQAVYVALPHDLLAGVARRALEAGRHVLVEKPVALAVADIESLDRLATAGGLALGVMLELRYTSAALAAREVVRKGRIGRLVQVRIRTLIDKPLSYWSVGYTGRSKSGWRASRARAGGGVVLMNSIHLIDLLHTITGEQITRITGETATLVGAAEVEDMAAAAFRMTGGAVGSLVANAHSLGALAEESLELDGTEGSVRLGDLYGPGWCRVWSDGSWQELELGPSDPYGATLEDFVAVVRTGAPAPVGAGDARAALAAVLSLYEDAARRSQP